MAALALSLIAGLLTSLSPCVLPAIPLVVGSAGARHRAGPVALAAGLILAFAAVGVGLAAAGDLLGLDGGRLRAVAASAFLAAGLVLVSDRLQARLASLLAPLANWAARRSSQQEVSGLAGQFGLGALLGLVWSPCTGPTLGAAVGLAAQGSVGRATALMLVFGFGAALPLLAAAYLARAFAARVADLRAIGGRGKPLLGVVLMVIGGVILSGLDRRLESFLVARLPEAWLDLITRY